MGDHRDHSADSRYHCGAGGTDGPDDSTCNVTAATVPVSNVIGKAVVIAWPPSRWRTLGTPKTFTSAANADRRHVVAPAFVVLPVFLVRAPPPPAAMTPVARVGGRVLVVDASQRVLLIHERIEDGTTHWLTPGGGVEAGEQPAEAARREASRRPASRSRSPPTPSRC